MRASRRRPPTARPENHPLSLQRLERRVLLSGTRLFGDIDLDTGTGTGPDGVMRILGEDQFDQSGYAVSTAGDVNGDGYDDFLIGALYADPPGGVRAGETYLVFGHAGGWTDVDFDGSVPASTAIRIFGDDAQDCSGRAVSAAGDVNGDGYDDFLIGAGLADPLGGDRAGETCLVFGHGGGWTDVDLDGWVPASTAIRIFGDDAGDHSGYAVSTAGDVNGDGYDDFLIGAPYADPAGGTGAGETYLVFGHGGGWTDVDFDSSVPASTAICIFGDDAQDCSGRAVSAAGDVNGDGYDDFLIGAWGADPPGGGYAGETYLVFGHAGGWADIDFDGSAPASTAIRIFGDDWADYSGSAVSTAGDVNGDGYDDFLIGAQYADPPGGSDAGETYLVFGHGGGWTDIDFEGSVPASTAIRIFGDDEGDESGHAVSTAGDVNGDGYDDLLIGAHWADTPGGDYAGETYLVFAMDDRVVGSGDRVDGALISFYDVDVSNGIIHPDIAWSLAEYRRGVTDVLINPGRIGDGIISAIVLFGDGSETADLGILVEDDPDWTDWDYAGLGSLVDARTSPTALGFLVSQGYVVAVNLRGGIAGYDLNSFTTEGGWELSADYDIDDDGETDDLTGVYVGQGYLRSLVARGDVNGDVVVGGDLNVLQVLGGDLNGDVVLTGSNIGTVLARAQYAGGWVGGDISGDICASGNIGAVLAIGGDVTGNIEAASGYIGRVLAQALYDPYGSGWVGGSISGDITAGQWIGSVQAIRGSAGVDSTIQAGGWINLVQSVGGDIAGSITATSGHVGRVLSQATWTGSAWQGGAVEADVTAGGYVASVVSVRGDGIDADVTAGSWVGSVVSVGGDVQGTVTALDGHVASVLARAAWNGLSWSGGSMDVDVSATGHVGSVISVNGAGMACGVTSGSWIGQVTSVGSDLDLTGRQITAPDRIGLVRAINGGIIGDGDDATWEVEVANGNLAAVQAINGAITGVSVDVAGAAPYLGNIGSVVSRGAGAGITQSLLEAEGRLTLVQAWGLWDPVAREYQGDLYNTTIHAGALGRVLVGGHIYEDDTDGDPDEIRDFEDVLTDRFFARDKTWAGWIDDGTYFGEHWFDEGEPDGVRAWVG